jgi:hypothetical protein
MKRNEVFCVIKYKVWLCDDYGTTEYAILKLMNDGADYSIAVITPKRARQIIAEYNMKEKFANNHGRVWELPRASFKKRFCGKFKYMYGD